MMKKLLLTLCLLCLSLLAVDRTIYQSRVDCTPERDWRTNDNCTAEQLPWPDGESGLTVRLNFDANPTGWPSGKFYLPSGVRDWRGAKNLRIEVYSTRVGRLGLNVHTFKDSTPHGFDAVNIPLGRSTIRLQLIEMKDFDLRNVKMIDFFSPKPEEPHALYVGDIALEYDDPEAERNIFRKELAVMHKSALWRLELLRPDSRAAVSLQELLPVLKTNTPTLDLMQKLRTVTKSLFTRADRALFAAAVNPATGVAALWCAPEEKVLRDEPLFQSRVRTEYELSAARGEGESAQIVLYAPEAQTAVRAVIDGALRSAEGNELPLSAMTLSPMGYVETRHPCYKVDYIGYWPDPILENLRDTAIPLEKNTFQSWWLDVDVPDTQQPGLYRGEIRLTTDIGETTLPIALKVRNFALPKGSPYLSVVPPNAWFLYPEDPAEKIEYEKKIAALLLKHRMDPMNIYSSILSTPERVAFAKWLVENGARSFCIGYLHTEVTPEIQEQLRKAYQLCQEAGIAEKAMVYCYDESPPSTFEMIQRSLKHVREILPGMPVMTTAYDSSFGRVSGLDDGMDIWIPLNKVYEVNQGNATAARERGRKVGWYVCCTPQPPYANFLLEQPGTAPRLLMGFMSWKYKPDCFLYYSSTAWRRWIVKKPGTQEVSEPLAEPISGGPLLKDPWFGESFRSYSGDGRLLYPAADGPVPTQRLKEIRDGMDDRLYLDALQNALEDPNTPKSAEWRKAAQKLLTVPNEMVESLTIWTTDAELLQEQRKQIADLLEEVAR